MRDYHELLISTVYWALGIVGALTLALLAFASYVNLRISGREIDAIRADIFGHVDQKLAETSRKLETEASKAGREFARIIDNLRERVESKSAEAIEQLRGTVQEEMENINPKIENGLLPVQQNIKSSNDRID